MTLNGDTTSPSDRAFSLIELLIVIVILGVLATVVVFAVGGIAERGEDSTCKADRKTLETAIEAYFGNYGVYASDQSVLVSSGYLLREASTHFSVSGPTITPVSGGIC